MTEKILRFERFTCPKCGCEFAGPERAFCYILKASDPVKTLCPNCGEIVEHVGVLEDLEINKDEQD